MTLSHPDDHPPHTLHALARAAGIAVDDGLPDPAIAGLTFDSRRVRSGWLYLAMPGARTHGARFSAQAVDQGAVAVLTDPDGAALAAGAGVPVLISDRPRQAMAAVAQAFHGHPSRQVPMFAVTGTNGKTTTTFLIEAALAELGLVVGTVGTLGFRLDGHQLDWSTSTVTTPEAPDLQHLFATMVERGAQAIAMEVSSHALALSRVAGTEFAVAGFTMLGRDHLDFHADMDDYFAAKASLFTGDALTGAGARHAVVCIDDDWGRKLAGLVTDRPLTTVGRAREADVRILGAETDPEHPGVQRVRLDMDGQRLEFSLPLPGDYNVTNAALALAMVHAAGLDAVVASRGLRHASVPGRMQRVDLPGAAPVVIVDFAHTPQAVDEALGAVTTPGRTLVVLGAGGDRDAEKRPLMGRAAARGADVVVVTDDNPRTEDPAVIRAAVAAGATGLGRAEVVEVGGRREAIRRALSLAGPEDVVMVLGKGHEQGQQVGDTVIEFDDVQVVRDEWATLVGNHAMVANGDEGRQ
ncbi:UDP-N-acetylmuramoyl-L-alanyl-D-glutamate--2,6-diaminopimelate ligase [Propionibacteriaceae bacterium G1746]